MGVLDGRRVLVVGASAGIGRAFAVHAAAEGARVVAVARRADRLEELVTEMGEGTAVVADISEEDDCRRIADELRRDLGEVDLVLHAAAMAPLKRFADTTADDWRRVLATNVIGVHQVIDAVLPLLAPGAIVGVLSSETIGQPRSGLGGPTARARPRSRSRCGAGTPSTPTSGSRAWRWVRPCPPSSACPSTCRSSAT